MAKKQVNYAALNDGTRAGAAWLACCNIAHYGLPTFIQNAADAKDQTKCAYQSVI